MRSRHRAAPRPTNPACSSGAKRRWPSKRCAPSAFGFGRWSASKRTMRWQPVLGCYSRTAMSGQVVLCTTDTDLFQCIRGERVVVLDRIRKRVTDEAAFRAAYGIAPSQFTDYLALVGAPAKGLPGVPGWGRRTANAMLECYGTVERIPADSAQWKPKLTGKGAVGRGTKGAPGRSHTRETARHATRRFADRLLASRASVAWALTGRGCRPSLHAPRQPTCGRASSAGADNLTAPRRLATRQYPQALLECRLRPFLKLIDGSAADRMVDHGERIIRHTECARDVAARLFKRRGANHQRRFAQLFEGDAVMHTAR